MMKLKKPTADGFKPSICAAARCKNPSDLIDGTKKHSTFNVPFCTDCWVEFDEEYEAAHPKEVVQVKVDEVVTAEVEHFEVAEPVTEPVVEIDPEPKEFVAGTSTSLTMPKLF